MIINQQYDKNRWFRIAYRICFALALAIALTLALNSCTSTTKGKTVLKTFNDSTYIHELESRVRVLTIENEKLESTIREMEYKGVVFETDTSCNEELRAALIRAGVNADSLIGTMNSLKNKVKFFADGSFEAEGRLKNVTWLKNRLEESNRELKRTSDSLAKVKEKEKVVTITRTIFKEKSVKRKGMRLFFLTLCFITGCWFWNRYGERIKKFFQKSLLLFRPKI